METLDNLKKTLDTSKSIKQVVSTMKALSGANIKKYEKIVKILYTYKSNVELALQAVMMHNDKININELEFVGQSKSKKANNLVVIFGSNQGLCGRFNDKIANFVIDDIDNIDNNKVIVVGERLSMLLSNTKLKIFKTIPVPNSIENISNTIYELLSIIEEEIENKTINKVFLYYTANDDTMNGTLTKNRLIPIDKKILENAQKKVWPTNNIPYWQVDTKTLIVDLLKQYIFVGLNDALVNSIASEQKNRLLTLQNAENNINDLIRSKNLEYNQKRQSTITNELLDVVTGYSVSKRKKK